MSRQRLRLSLQVILVLLASLIGVMINYATSVENAPLIMRTLRQVAIPGLVLLVVVLIITQVVAYQLDKPLPPPQNWDPQRTPYPGLDAFTEAEAAIFFGREAQIGELTRRLHDASPKAPDRFVALVGASGSGKSSLARAGVLPRLRQRRWMVLPVLTPGSNPLGALAGTLAEAGATGGVNSVLRRLRRKPAELGIVIEEVRTSQGHRFGRLLVVIDQFEELVTLAGERERAFFLAALAEALAHDSRLWFLATMRIEFLRDFLETTQTELFQNPVAIGAISRTQLLQVVEAPGALVGMRFESGLADTIVDDAGTSDALPLLAYLLQELYFTAGPGKTATEANYRAIGGVAGALSRQADQLVAELGGTDGPTAILAVLLKFVTIEGQESARRRVRLADLTDDERRMVDAFVDARLLVADVSNGMAYADVAHEAIFRQWPPLRQEVETQAERLRRRAELERWAIDWERSGRSDDYLLTGDRLALAQRWLTDLTDSGQASEQVLMFVDGSKRRDLAFLRRISEGIGRHVLANAERYPDLSILLSLAALSECVATPVAQRALMAAMTFSHVRMILTGHTDTVRNVAWSPDGSRIATASRDGTARIFDAESGRALITVDGHEAMVEMVAWSPDSLRIATASRDHTIRIWDASTGQQQQILTGAADHVRGVAWSTDGRRVAGVSRDLVVRVWDMPTGDVSHALHGHKGNIIGIGWNPDGRSLATASHDRTAVVWDLGTGEPSLTLSGHTDFVEGLAWSPDGKRLATSSGDHTIRIWDGKSGRQRLLIRGHADQVWNVAWSPDGTHVLSVSTDRTARIFDGHDARPIAILRGHTDTVWGAAWSPDGSRVATGSEDASIRIWDVQPRGAEDVVLTGHRSQVNQAAWISDERGIVTVSEDRSVRFWEAATGKEIEVIGRHSDQVWAVAVSPAGRIATGSSDMTVRIWQDFHPSVFHHGSTVEAVAWSPDGSRIASGGHDAMLRIWAVETGQELAALAGHQDWIGGVVWSPSGRMIATVSDDRSCRLWDIRAGTQLTVLHGHDNWVDDVSWSPDERHVVTSSADWTARVWEVATGRQAATLRGHEGRVRAVAWSPHGHRIATGSDDRTVRVWDADTREEITVAGVHQDKVTSVTWSADGRRLLTSSFDGTARIWPAEPDFDRLQHIARSRVFRSLTEEERRTHMLPTARER